jgi:hypothetical protein
MTKSSPTTPSPETITLEVRISMYKFWGDYCNLRVAEPSEVVSRIPNEVLPPRK